MARIMVPPHLLNRDPGPGLFAIGGDPALGLADHAAGIPAWRGHLDQIKRGSSVCMDRERVMAMFRNPAVKGSRRIGLIFMNGGL